MNNSIGIKVKDTITGLEGIIIGYCQYLSGCDQYLVAPRVDKEGKYLNAVWFDVNRLKDETHQELTTNNDVKYEPRETEGK